jgi:hypothetical protein
MSLLASSTNDGGGAVTVIVIVALIWAVLVIAGWWKVFTKADRPGWAALVPIFNVYTMCKVAGRPGWWIVLFLIPIVNIVAYLVLMVDLARSFGKGFGFSLGLVFLSPLFAVILGFGSATYRGPAAAMTPPPAGA